MIEASRGEARCGARRRSRGWSGGGPRGPPGGPLASSSAMAGVASFEPSSTMMISNVVGERRQRRRAPPRRGPRRLAASLWAGKKYDSAGSARGRRPATRRHGGRHGVDRQEAVAPAQTPVLPPLATSVMSNWLVELVEVVARRRGSRRRAACPR